MPEGAKYSRLCHYVCTFGLIVGKGMYKILIIVFRGVIIFSWAPKFWKNLLLNLHSYCVDEGNRFLQNGSNHVLNTQFHIPENMM